jgi:hypothetical protein
MSGVRIPPHPLFRGSSNGRTPGSDPVNPGSNPGPRATRASSNGRTLDFDSSDGGSSPSARTYAGRARQVRKEAARAAGHLGPWCQRLTSRSPKPWLSVRIRADLPRLRETHTAPRAMDTPWPETHWGCRTGGVSAALSARRSRVRLSSAPPPRAAVLWDARRPKTSCGA